MTESNNNNIPTLDGVGKASVDFSNPQSLLASLKRPSESVTVTPSHHIPSAHDVLADIIPATAFKPEAPEPTPVTAAPTPIVEDVKPETAEEGFSLFKDELPEIKDEVVEAVQETDDDLEDKELDKAMNFSRLRGKYKETKTKFKEVEARKIELEERLSKYENGEEIPEIIRPNLEKIQEYEKYKNIFDLKSSPAYKEKFIDPLNSIGEELDKYAEDYKIPKEELRNALQFKNKADLNNWLSDNFDPVGALKVEELITKSQGIVSEMRKADQEPKQAFDSLAAEFESHKIKQREQQLEIIKNSSKSAFYETISQIQNEGIFQELIEKAGDEDHNNRFVKPIREKAGREYGKLVQLLAQNGLTSLPPELAKALSRATLYSLAAGVAATTRDAAIKYANDLKTNTSRNTTYERPTIGRRPGSMPSYTPPAKPQTSKEAAQSVVETVLNKR